MSMSHSAPSHLSSPANHSCSNGVWRIADVDYMEGYTDAPSATSRLVDVYLPTHAYEAWRARGFDTQQSPLPFNDGESPMPLPVAMYFHGGAWFLGHKNVHDSRKICEYLVRNAGCMAVAVSYTLSTVSNDVFTSSLVFSTAAAILLGLVSTFIQKMWLLLLWSVLAIAIVVTLSRRPLRSAQHPCHIRDCARATRWVRDTCASYGGDPALISVIGHSAGAHLASLLVTNRKYLNEVGLGPRDITSCVCLSGVYNDRSFGAGGRLAKSILEGTFGKDKRKYADAFPIHHADPAMCPPLFLANASRDLMLKRQAVEFRSVLLQNRVYVEARVYPITNHFSITMQWTTENRDVGADVVDFLERTVQERRLQNE